MKRRKDYSMEQGDYLMSEWSKSSFYINYLHDIDEDCDHLKKLKFQIDSNSYFASLATIIDLIVQDSKNFQKKRYVNLMEKIREDLLYLQDRYVIVDR